MINETQQGHEQKYEFTCMFCSVIHNSIFLLLLLFLLLLCNFVVATITLHITNANRSTTSGQLDICSQIQLRCLMRKVVLHNEYHCVIICQIDGVRICINWSGENIVCITFLYIACKNI